MTMQKIRATRDAAMAGKLSDHLRARGATYDDQVSMYANYNDMDIRDARDEWEDLMSSYEDLI